MGSKITLVAGIPSVGADVRWNCSTRWCCTYGAWQVRGIGARSGQERPNYSCQIHRYRPPCVVMMDRGSLTEDP